MVISNGECFGGKLLSIEIGCITHAVDTLEFRAGISSLSLGKTKSSK